MHISITFVYFLLSVLFTGQTTAENNPTCRFAPLFTKHEIVQNPEPFISDVLYWEGKFAKPGVGYNGENAMTYDGTLLNFKTGLEWKHARGRHNFSAASKEALHVMVLAHAINGDSDAARFISPHSPSSAPDIAYGLMKQKLETYLAFNKTYPGFGGYLPWYNNTYKVLAPTDDWVNRVPGLDNGELIWAVYAAVQALDSSSKANYKSLATKWQLWLDYTKQNAVKMFYYGKGRVCAVVDLKQHLHPDDPKQNYTCEGNSYLDDPYEGELFTWWL